MVCIKFRDLRNWKNVSPNSLPMLKYKKRFRNQRISTGALITLEIFAIVTGVMLGFLANEWRENRTNQKTAENALYSIASEFRFNHMQMEESFSYYSAIIQQIDSLRVAGQPVSEMYGYELEGFRGATPPMLRSSAYNMILMTGIIKDIPFETANRLAFIYNVQSMLERLDDAALFNFTQDPGFTELRKLRHMFILYTDIIPSVIGSYQKFGLPVLEPYGYNLHLPEGELKRISEMQIEYLSPDRI
jgi:hypothetical protein